VVLPSVNRPEHVGAGWLFTRKAGSNAEKSPSKIPTSWLSPLDVQMLGRSIKSENTVRGEWLTGHKTYIVGTLVSGSTYITLRILPLALIMGAAPYQATEVGDGALLRISGSPT